MIFPEKISHGYENKCVNLFWTNKVENILIAVLPGIYKLFFTVLACFYCEMLLSIYIPFSLSFPYLTNKICQNKRIRLSSSSEFKKRGKLKKESYLNRSLQFLYSGGLKPLNIICHIYIKLVCKGACLGHLAMVIPKAIVY